VAQRCDGWESFPKKTLDIAASAIESSPNQCLREIQASAIDAAVDFEDGRYCETVSDRIDMILDYANLIRKGTKP
jgi:homoserine acetyltransferase